MSSAGRRFLAITAFALLLRVAFAWFYGLSTAPSEWADDWYYDRVATQLAQDWTYSDQWFPPGYPFLLAAIYSLFGHSLAAVRLIQAAVAASACGATYLLGRRVFGEREGALSALLLAVYPPHIYFSWRLMAEGSSIFLMLAAGILAIRLLDRPTVLAGAALGLCVGFANLFKSNLLLLPLFLIAWLAVVGRGQWQRRACGLAATAACCALMGAVIPVLSLRAGAGTLLPRNAGHTLWYSNNPLATGYYIDPTGAPAAESFIREHGLEDDLKRAGRDDQDRIYQRLAIAWIRENPGDFLKLVGKKLWNAYSPVPEAAVFNQSGRARLAFLLTYGAFLPFMAVGVLWSLRNNRTEVQLLYVVILSYTAMVVIFYGTPRFTILVTPYLLLFAAVPLVALWRRTGLSVPIGWTWP